jgi:hypothetical protein
MTKQCENFKELDKRMLKWLDHVGCTPNKWQRYDLLKSFVQMVTIETAGQHSETSMRETLSWLNGSAKTLLKELEQDELLRSNGLAESRKESNPQ